MIANSESGRVELFTAATVSLKPVGELKAPIRRVIWHQNPPGVSITAGEDRVTIDISFPDGTKHFIR